MKNHQNNRNAYDTKEGKRKKKISTENGGVGRGEESNHIQIPSPCFGTKNSHPSPASSLWARSSCRICSPGCGPSVRVSLMWMMYTDNPARGGGDGGGGLVVVESEESSDVHRAFVRVFASPVLINSVMLGVRSCGCDSRALTSLELLYRGCVLCADINACMQSSPIHEFAGKWGTGRFDRGLTCSLPPPSAESESFRFRLLLERRRPSACCASTTLAASTFSSAIRCRGHKWP